MATSLSELGYGAQPFIIDDIVLGRVAKGDETGLPISNALPSPYTYSVEDVWEVVEQPVPGFKTITQATEPVSIKRITVDFESYTREDWQAIMSLENTKPHVVKCAMIPETIIVYLLKRTCTHEHGKPEYTFQWHLEMIQANDNN